MSDDRNTPEEVLEPVRRFMPIRLDPCSNSTSTVGAAAEWTEGGLTRSWVSSGTGDPASGTVWVNPPWSAHLAWASKSVSEYRRGAEVLYWCPAYTETEWFKVLWSACRLVCFWGHRVHHPDPASSGKAGSMWPTALVYLGNDPQRFFDAFHTEGQVVQPLHAVPWYQT